MELIILLLVAGLIVIFVDQLSDNKR